MSTRPDGTAPVQPHHMTSPYQLVASYGGALSNAELAEHFREQAAQHPDREQFYLDAAVIAENWSLFTSVDLGRRLGFTKNLPGFLRTVCLSGQYQSHQAEAVGQALRDLADLIESLQPPEGP